MHQPKIQQAHELGPLAPELKRFFSFVQRGDVVAVTRELEAGLPVNFIDPATTDSPLMLACRKGYTNIVMLCLDFGAKNDPHPDFGQTALHAAVASGHFTCAEVILKVAAASDADHIISNLTDQYGQTPLHCAALIGSVPMTELLLRHGAQLSAVDSYGQTPLHLSAGSVNKACLAVLLDHGGDEVIEVSDVYGNRPLHHAVYHGRLECAKLLLETAADVTARNSKNLTPYNLASMQGHHQIGLLLLEYKDHHNVPPSTCATPNKLAFFTPNKGLQRPVFSPQQLDTDHSPTPPNSRYDDKEFRTPMTSNKHEIAVSIHESPPHNGLSLGIPEFRRNQSNDLAGLHLPRPHTVGSPSVNNKALSLKKRSSKNPSVVSSPLEGNRKSSNLDFGDGSSSQLSFTTYLQRYDDNHAMPQLSTPLFSRDVSNRTTSSFENFERGDDTNLDEPQGSLVEDRMTYLSGGNYTPSKQAHREEIDSQKSHRYEYGNYPREAINSEPMDAFDESPDEPESLSTPKRKVECALQEEAEFADPLEVFSCCDRLWHVYLTEQSDIYYLDMENHHSQWEDPRCHGVILMTSYYDFPPESPSKLSDSAPPLSPALKSPTHSSPSVGLSGSAIKSDSELKRVAQSFQRVFTFDVDSVDHQSVEAPKSSTLRGLGIASIDCNHDHVGNVVGSSDEDDNKPDLVQNLAKRNVRKLFIEQQLKSSGNDSESKFVPQNENGLVDSYDGPKQASPIPIDDDNTDDLQKSHTVNGGERVKANNGKLKRDSWVTNKKDEQDKIDPPERSFERSHDLYSSQKEIIIPQTINLDECQIYVEMINAGRPLHDVRQRLEADGRSGKFISKVMELADDLVILDDKLSDVASAEDTFASPKSTSRSDKASVGTQVPVVTLESLKDDFALAKYVKMAKMGVPPMSVITKMKMDNVESGIVERMQQALGLIPIVTNNKDDLKEEKWQPVPEERLKNSIWAFASAGNSDSPLLAEQELKELEQLFLAAPTVPSMPNPDKLIPKQTFSLKLLEGKRAQNITIGLVAFKGFGSHIDVIKAICSLNDFHGKLSSDHLQNFKSLLPTESEVKKSFLLKNVNHPAEIFVQSALIFYPELPLRLDAFVICLNFNSFASELEKRMKLIMDVINQILSSPKLARILQKLLAIGKVMLEPSAGTASSKIKSKASLSDAKVTVLEQLLQVSNTKGVDRKTSLLDYMVKGLYDKNEENLLGVIDDLSQLADSTLPLSTSDALGEYENLKKQLSYLQKEMDRVQPSNNVFSSPTAKAMSDVYCVTLEKHVTAARDRIAYIDKRKVLFTKKVRSLMEYFGEDPKNTDNNNIFHALKEFRRALCFSKETVEWKLSRNHQM